MNRLQVHLANLHPNRAVREATEMFQRIEQMQQERNHTAPFDKVEFGACVESFLQEVCINIGGYGTVGSSGALARPQFAEGAAASTIDQDLKAWIAELQLREETLKLREQQLIVTEQKAAAMAEQPVGPASSLAPLSRCLYWRPYPLSDQAAERCLQISER